MPTFFTWPPNPFDPTNPYLPLYHGALERQGFRFLGGLRISDDFLRGNAGRVQGIQFHWGIEAIWRRPAQSHFARSRALAGFWTFLRLARKLGYRIVWTVHNLEPHEGADVYDQWGYRILAGQADVCVFHSEDARMQFLRRYRSRRTRAVVMPMGNYDGYYPAPASRTEVRRCWNIPLEARLLLCCGMIRPYKGYELAIEAMARLGPDIRLIVCGPAPLPEYSALLQRLARKDPRITVLAQTLSDQEFADLHHASDCILLPYRRITGSSAVLAAGTLGRGVVASDLPFFRELIELEPEAGILFPAGDAAQLAAAVEAFFNGPIDRRHAAARRIADRFPWDEVVRPVVEALNGCGLVGQQKTVETAP